MMQLTDGERIARDLCEAESPIDNIIEVDPTDVARRIDESFAELRAKLAAAQKEVERLKTVPMKYRRMAFNAQLQDENNELRARLAKAEQQVAEWQPIETAPKETEIFIGRFIDGKFRFCRSALIYEHANEFAGETWSGWLWSIDDCNDSIADCPTHWMPLPKPPAIDAAMLSQGEQK